MHSAREKKKHIRSFVPFNPFPFPHEYFSKTFFLTLLNFITRSSESDVRSDVTDSLECPDKFRVP